MSHTSSGNVPTHKYDQRWKLKGTSGYPGTTYAKLLNGRYKHAHSVTSKACFWKTKITTEAGSNTVWGSIRKGQTLESGLDASRTVNWEYDDFHASDKNLNVSQIMVVPFFNDAPCSAGMSASAAMEHYSDWCPASTIIAGLASISFAGSPPRPGPVAGLHRCGSWGRQTPG